MSGFQVSLYSAHPIGTPKLSRFGDPDNNVKVGKLVLQREGGRRDGAGAATYPFRSQNRERKGGLLISCVHATRGLRRPSLDAHVKGSLGLSLNQR